MRTFTLHYAAPEQIRGAEITPGRGKATPMAAALPQAWQARGAALVEPRAVLRPQRRRLRRVTFSDGHPREKAFLRPYSSRSEANGDRTDVYRFSPVSNDGIWIVCQYERTHQTLSRPLTASTCEVTASDRPESRVRSVFCQ